MLQPVETPKANPERLLSLLEDASRGKVVIPEFQRSFVWTREDIEELLVSILQGYFIGTFLILDTPTEKPMFPFRAVEGLHIVNPSARPERHSTVRLVLDGQQRITSLFYVLHEPPIPLRNTKHPYRFFFRLDLALDADPSDAVFGISLADRRRMAEMERLVAEHRAVPLTLFRDQSRFYKWFYHEQRFLREDREKELVEGFHHRFANFMIPVVTLSQEAGTDNVVNIFERINRTGVSLSLFDLAVARLYLKGVRLRDLWEEFRQGNRTLAEVIKPEFVLKVIALGLGREPKRSTLLDVVDQLEAEQFEKRWKTAAEFMRRAYTRVGAASGGYGAFHPNWIPYTTLLVPLAALLSEAESRKAGEEAYRKIDRWYWASVFTQRYDSAVDTKSHADVREVLRWIDGGEIPSWVEAVSSDAIDLQVDEPRSAVYRGLMCLVAIEGARDFITGQAPSFHECQDDHIFPASRFGKAHDVNLVLNRTLISAASNRAKSNLRPSEFVHLFRSKHGNDEARFRSTLRSHFISDEALSALESDDFDRFVESREKEFRKRIGELIDSR